MALAEELLTCLALERRLYAIFCRWAGSVGTDDPTHEQLLRQADACDRHRRWLWELCMHEQITPPPLPELELEPEASYPAHIRASLRELAAHLPRLIAEVSGPDRDRLERLNQEMTSQYEDLVELAPEPAITFAPEGIATEAPPTHEERVNSP
jgi:hypothetical protein